MPGYDDLYWTAGDGVRLHARDYPGAGDRLPLLCLAGLTRNARDYAAFAEGIAGRRRVIAVDFRGRGESAPAKDATSYVPATYVEDVAALLAEQGIARCVAVGTSLGGIVAMLLAARAPGTIAAAVLNDVGPDIEAAGLARIRGHVGRASSCPTWLHAARTVREAHGDAHPDWGLEDWIGMAKRLYRVTGSGRIALDYDLRIAEPFRLPPPQDAPDLWQAYAVLAEAPLLVVRGARSDVLSTRTAERMVAAARDATLVTVPDTGHAPTLAEPAAAAAVAALLDRVP